MYSVENKAGRLVQIRLATPMDAGELGQFQAAHRAVVAALDGPFVAVVDARKAHVFPQEIVRGLIGLMSASNARIERSAFLISNSATFSLQAARSIREAKNPHRQAFQAPEELEAWLAEILTPAEQEQLHKFLEPQ